MSALEENSMTNIIARVLIIVAHPDDAEAGAGGTVAKLVTQGSEVSFVIVTNGHTGSSDRTMTRDRLASIREAEQREAARTLGVSHVEFLGYNDAEVEDTHSLRLDITRQIRKWRPDLVITQSPHRTDNLFASHRDHRITGGAVLDCVYPLARDHLAFPELLPEYEPHRVREVHLMQWQAENHEFAVDISETVDLKLKAFGCHKSQFPDFTAVAVRVRDRCARLGKPYGYAYAETFDRVLIPR
jgi:LmbE family N-acetylglucosaminyl deacetylase